MLGLTNYLPHDILAIHSGAEEAIENFGQAKIGTSGWGC